VTIALEGVGMHSGHKAHIQYALSLLSDVDDVPKLYKALRDVAAHFQANNFNFIANYPTLFGSTQISITDLPKQWCELYRMCNFEKADPIVSHCSARMTPILWWSAGDCDDATSTNVRTRSFVSEACRFGMRSGVSFPLHGINGSKGILTMSYKRHSDETKPWIEQATPYFQLLSAYVFETAQRVIRPQDEHWLDRGLTRRELECLSWCAEGKTSWEIAKILGITERTVHFHMQNASRRLGASSRSHAVQLAALHRVNAAVDHHPPHRVISLCGSTDVEHIEVREIDERARRNSTRRKTAKPAVCK